MKNGKEELFRKRDLCLKAAHECKSINMWKMWISKANYLHHKAMMEDDDA